MAIGNGCCCAADDSAANGLALDVRFKTVRRANVRLKVGSVLPEVVPQACQEAPIRAVESCGELPRQPADAFKVFPQAVSTPVFREMSKRSRWRCCLCHWPTLFGWCGLYMQRPKDSKEVLRKVGDRTPRSRARGAAPVLQGP